MNQIEQLRNQAKELEALSITLKKAADGLEKLADKSPSDAATSPKGPLPPPRVPPPTDAVSAIRAVMREAGHPLSKDEILQRVHAKGNRLAESSLTSYLSKFDDFVSRGRDQWTLAAIQVA